MVQPYAAPRWLPGGNAQTIWPLLRKGLAPDYRRERWDTPDGDFIDVDWTDGPAQQPLLALFHGLEGSSASHYALSLMRAVKARGWRGAVVHFRGCSSEPNRLPRAYHSGDSAEIDWILRRLRASRPGAPLFAAGVSLGGNALLKWLGEQGRAAHAVVDAAAGISAPLDLAAANEALSRGFGLAYARHFLRTLVPAALAKLARHPGLFDAAAVTAARTLRDFDDAVTAPLHGFADAADYYARSSAGQFLPGIEVPTLVLNARNDPFLPAAALPRRAGPAVVLEQPDEGGHAGFVCGPFPGSLSWMPARVMAHFRASGGMP
ncbi:MAG TPA: alpha/beta fold hydrolase [Rhodocyclaceae bacterium]